MGEGHRTASLQAKIDLGPNRICVGLKDSHPGSQTNRIRGPVSESYANPDPENALFVCRDGLRTGITPTTTRAANSKMALKHLITCIVAGIDYLVHPQILVRTRLPPCHFSSAAPLTEGRAALRRA